MLEESHGGVVVVYGFELGLGLRWLADRRG